MTDEKEGELAKETFLKLGWDIYDERDVEVLSEAFKSRGKSCYESGLNAGMELCARYAVRRMTSWSVEDDRMSQEFREGIEQACSDLAIKFRDGSLAEPWIKELDRAVPYERLQEMYDAESRKNVHLQEEITAGELLSGRR